jgi:hypothetical protein
MQKKSRGLSSIMITFSYQYIHNTQYSFFLNTNSSKVPAVCIVA